YVSLPREVHSDRNQVAHPGAHFARSGRRLGHIGLHLQTAVDPVAVWVRDSGMLARLPLGAIQVAAEIEARSGFQGDVFYGVVRAVYLARDNRMQWSFLRHGKQPGAEEDLLTDLFGPLFPGRQIAGWREDVMGVQIPRSVLQPRFRFRFRA